MKPFVADIDERLSRRAYLLLGGCLVLFAYLRLRWTGHLLVWDEAMTLCTARSFTSHADDVFAGWFWRHPPLYTLLMLLIQPLKQGFAERAEILTVGIAILNQVLLFVLNRRIFGVVIALWAAFFAAILPGSALFDVWIKQDHPVVTFGLLALLCLYRGNALFAGLFLGVALLAKETGGYYALAVMLVWVCGACGKRTVRDFLALTVTPALTAGWWYFIVVPKAGIEGLQGGRGLLEHLNFAFKASHFRDSWTYYFTQMPVILGWIALPLCLAGVWFVLRRAAKSTRESNAGDSSAVWWLWPVGVIGPALLLLSLIPSKVPWMVIPMFPAWATLAAVAVTQLKSLVAERFHDHPASAWAGIGGNVAIAIACFVIAFNLSYEPLLSKVAEPHWRGAKTSRDLALALNAAAKDGDRVLLTSFYFWRGVPPGHPDPIFTYYLTKRLEFLVRSHTLGFDKFAGDIREFRLDWAMLSPEPGPAAEDLFGRFQNELHLTPQQLLGAWLFNTTSVRNTATNVAANP